MTGERHTRAVLGLLLAVPAGVVVIIRYVTSEFAVTNKRIILKTGFLQRNTVEMLLTKVESIFVHQGLLGRLLDFGTIRVLGTGGGGTPFRNIAGPMELRAHVQTQIESIDRSS